MYVYYDCVVFDIRNNSSISFWADAFSVDENGHLRIYSKECGNVVVRILEHERLRVNIVIVQDEFEEINGIEV